MHRLARLLFLGILTVSWLSCSAERRVFWDYPVRETAVETSAALNGFSTYPSQNEPWTCLGPVSPYPAWTPNTNPWAMNAVNSWCQWQPASWESSSQFPFHVWSCVPGGPQASPQWNGSAQLYSGDHETGSCALTWGGDTAHPLDPYQYDADLFELNGWHDTWTTNGSAQTLSIKSMIIGPWTHLIICSDPLTGPPSATCTGAHGADITTGPNPVPYNFVDFGAFYIAAMQIQAVQ